MAADQTPAAVNALLLLEGAEALAIMTEWSIGDAFCTPARSLIDGRFHCREADCCEAARSITQRELQSQAWFSRQVEPVENI